MPPWNNAIKLTLLALLHARAREIISSTLTLPGKHQPIDDTIRTVS